MNISVMDNSAAGSFCIPLSFIFWGFVAAYAMHIFEESVLGEVFVEKVQRLYWPQYTWGKFAGFNAILISLEILSIALYEAFGGAWVVFPLILFSERFFNAFMHLIETLATGKFSSGLLSGVIFWILGYFIIRFAVVPGNIETGYWVTGAVVGLCITLLMACVLTLNVMKKAWDRKDRAAALR